MQATYDLSSNQRPACASMHHQLLIPGVQITWDDLKAAESAVGDFGSDNRAGVQGTLHRISAMRSRKGTIVGLTCRVGRAVTGHVDMIRDILDGDKSEIAGKLPRRSVVYDGLYRGAMCLVPVICSAKLGAVSWAAGCR